MVLFCAADLIWGSRIKATAQAAGVEARPVRDLGMLEARLADSPVRGLVVDLEAPAALQLIGRVRGEGGRADVRVVAFGPHVDVERLAAARAAGAERVMVRGAFDRGLAEILVELDRGV
jgi:hypothetical protein